MRKKENDDNTWKLVGKEKKYKKRRTIRQLIVFYITLITILFLFNFNFILNKYYNTNLFVFLNKMIFEKEEIKYEEIKYEAVTSVPTEIRDSINKNEEITNEIEEDSVHIDEKNNEEYINKLETTFTRWKDLNFLVYKDSLAVSEYKKMNDLFSIDYFSTTVEKNEKDEYVEIFKIEFLASNNVNNLNSLDEIIKGMEAAEKVGSNFVMDKYTMQVYDKNNNSTEKTIIVTYNQIMDLANNKKIEVDGIKYDIKDFSNYNIDCKYDCIEDVKIANVDAKKFYDLYSHEIKYVFVYKNNIYSISTVDEEISKNELDKLISSITFN